MGQEYVIAPSVQDAALAVREGIALCKEKHWERLRLEKGTYHFYPETAAEDTECCVSNHGFNGYKRCAFLIKNMQNFEVDCSGSLLVFHGAMNAFILRGCENVSVKNCRVLYERTNHGQFLVTDWAADEDGAYVELKPCGEREHVYENRLLYLENEQGLRDLVYTCEEINKDTLEYETGEQCFGKKFLLLKNKDGGDGSIRIYQPERKPRVGNYVVLLAAQRYVNGFLFLESSRVKALDCTVYSCFGVAFHGQLCRDVELERCATALYGGRCFSSNADATHFVGCRGKVTLKDCRFENQLDDGMNVHGVFTKVIGWDKESILVKYEHFQCRGISLFEAGCQVNLLRPGTLLPYGSFQVARVEELNTECTRLYPEGGTGGIEWTAQAKRTDETAQAEGPERTTGAIQIAVGDLADSIDFYPDVLVEGCRFVNNRARGILVGSRKETVIRDNYFHLPGTAVKLESDSSYWYESGGVGRLVVENNIFDRCRYIDSDSWGKELIYTSPREELVDGEYYHGEIIIKDNDFRTCNAPAADVENIRSFVFQGNQLNEKNTVSVRHCGEETVIIEGMI